MRTGERNQRTKKEAASGEFASRCLVVAGRGREGNEKEKEQERRKGAAARAAAGSFFVSCLRFLLFASTAAERFFLNILI